jgi:hypothetical protein
MINKIIRVIPLLMANEAVSQDRYTVTAQEIGGASAVDDIYVDTSEAATLAEQPVPCNDTVCFTGGNLVG